MPVASISLAEPMGAPYTDDSSTDPVLKVIIAGGGIGGITAAIALRQEGHEVEVYEQSQFANEVGAAIHIVPNANSVLQRLGVFHEEEGAVRLEQTRFFNSSAELLAVTDNKSQSHRWQKPWLQAHRAHLHTQLKRIATSVKGKGPPVRLHTSSKIVKVDPHKSTIILANGDHVHGDVIVGADGVHSACRKAIAGDECSPYKSNRSAFRFMVPRQAVLDDPETREMANAWCSMDMYYAADRKVVIYPCVNHTLLNFVCLHPAELSDASIDTYNKSASKEKLLEVYQDFNPKLLKVFQKCDAETLKVYPLFDVETLPTFINDRLALIGDAAHPFTPHLAQGGAQAIEDGVSLGVMLSRGVTSAEIPERLKLYNQARYERATRVQGYSRIVGEDGVSSDGDAKGMKVHDYIHYGVSHDEYHASIQVLREHLWKKSSKAYWRQPTVFGPMPGPRQDSWGNPRTKTLSNSTSLTATIRFKTSATLLKNMFPSSSYKFTLPDTVAVASLTVQSLQNMAWLGGGGYDLLMFEIHGVNYTKPDGSSIHGRFCPVLFENLTDPILSGREELGWPKLFSDIDVDSSGNAFEVSVSWRGARWASLWLRGLQEPGGSNSVAAKGNQQATESGLLIHKFIPTTTDQGHQSKTDADYDVFVPDLPATNSYAQNGDAKPTIPKPTSCRVSTDAGFKIAALGEKELPTIHHVVSRLAEVPIFEVLDAHLVTEQGVRDLSDARRIS